MTIHLANKVQEYYASTDSFDSKLWLCNVVATFVPWYNISILYLAYYYNIRSYYIIS